jgi:hypothetical protein
VLGAHYLTVVFRYERTAEPLKCTGFPLDDHGSACPGTGQGHEVSAALADRWCRPTSPGWQGIPSG